MAKSSSSAAAKGQKGAKTAAPKAKAAARGAWVQKKKQAQHVRRLQGGKLSLRSALHEKLRRQGGRTDVRANDTPEHQMQAMMAMPVEQRAGWPVRRARGSQDPRQWRTNGGKDVVIDFSREAWLPNDWAQGVKSTKKKSTTKCTENGGTYIVYMPPDGRTFYHKWSCEDYLDRKLGPSDGFDGQMRFANLQLKQARLTPDADFLKILSAGERKVLPGKGELYFAVVSARRTRTNQGVKDIATVQAHFLWAGVSPTWYVDAESVEEYRALGLKAVVGGKLTAARNLALKDAQKAGKACVQCSDDISHWEYRHGPMAKERTDDACNAAHAAALSFPITPVAAARFILAKMRGACDAQGRGPQLGGVYCLGVCARTFAGPPFRRAHFIIGDFFVVSDCTLRFDEKLTLKEDYDLTCSALAKHGSVVRCERMTISAKHYSNAGGACANRDQKGQEERKNMAILYSKWPGAIFEHGTRKNEVKLRWPGDAEVARAGHSAKAAGGKRALE